MKRIKTQCLPTVTTAERSICCHEQPVERAAVMAGLECVDFGEAACPSIPALSPGTGQQTPEHKFENYFAREISWNRQSILNIRGGFSEN